MANWQTVARQAAQRHGVDPGIFIRQIRQESGGRDVTSGAGAQGPAQFIPGTARQYGLNSSTVHELGPSLDAAARLMSDNLKKYGDYRRALSAYNSGKPDAYKDPAFAGGQTYNYVKTILGSSSPTASRPASPQPSQSLTTTTTTPGVDNSQARRALVANFLAQGGVKSTNAVGALASGYQAAQDVPGTTTTTTTAQPGTTPTRTATGGGTVARVKARADAINAQHLPYSWGGGHAGKTSIHQAVPLDCSGAVSKALGIDPRVSGQFETWGKAGDGGSHGVTVAANGHHVLMKIDGHWFGTSASNPGGGAGWIPQANISPEYLRGFTLRHM